MTFGKTPTGAVLVLQRGCGSDGADETSAGYLILGTSKVISTTLLHSHLSAKPHKKTYKASESTGFNQLQFVAELLI